MHQKGDTERNGSGSQNNGYEVAVTIENIYENIGPRKPIDLGKRRAWKQRSVMKRTSVLAGFFVVVFKKKKNEELKKKKKKKKNLKMSNVCFLWYVLSEMVTCKVLYNYLFGNAASVAD